MMGEDDLIQEEEETTSMTGFKEHLEDMYGGPITQDQEVENVPEMVDAELEPIDTYELQMMEHEQT